MYSFAKNISSIFLIIVLLFLALPQDSLSNEIDCCNEINSCCCSSNVNSDCCLDRNTHTEQNSQISVGSIESEISIKIIPTIVFNLINNSAENKEKINLKFTLLKIPPTQSSKIISYIHSFNPIS